MVGFTNMYISIILFFLAVVVVFFVIYSYHLMFLTHFCSFSLIQPVITTPTVTYSVSMQLSSFPHHRFQLFRCHFSTGDVLSSPFRLQGAWERLIAVKSWSSGRGFCTTSPCSCMCDEGNFDSFLSVLVIVFNNNYQTFCSFYQ